jgi:hypothetical protein
LGFVWSHEFVGDDLSRNPGIRRMASRRNDSKSNPPNTANRRRISSASLLFADEARFASGVPSVVPRVPLCPLWFDFFLIYRKSA